METVKELEILRLKGETAEGCTDVLISEERYTFILNGGPVHTFSCTPTDLEQLGAGFALSRGYIGRGEDITLLETNHLERTIRLNAAPQVPGDPARRRKSSVFMSPDEIYRVWEDFDSRCSLFRSTGAAHAVGLITSDRVLSFKEDAARHNALLKVMGEMVLRKISPRDKALVFSGRLALEMLEMASKSGVRLLLSHGAVTAQAAETARETDITLAGFVRPGGMNIYCHSRRICK